MKSIALWIVVGGFIGWEAATLLMQNGRITFYTVIGSILVGIAGALVGGWLGHKARIEELAQAGDHPTGLWSIFWAIVGTLIFLFFFYIFFLHLVGNF